MDHSFRLAQATMRRTRRAPDRPAPVGSLPAWLTALLGLVVLLMGQAEPVRAAEGPTPSDSRAALIRFEGDIDGRLELFVFSKLHAAEQEGVDLVILEIDSPGGRLYESLRIAARLRDSEIHTVAYVPDMALSGAAIVSLGCDELIMGPNGKLGDAGAIYQAEGYAFREVPAKFRTHLVAEVRGLAESKGRPPALAEAMVDNNKVVFRVRNTETDEIAFLSDHEIEADVQPERWEKINPVQESLGDNYLEVGGRRAVELQLAQGNAANRDEMLARYGIDPKELIVYEPTSLDATVYILSSPLITGLLLLVGLVALYIEFSAPGIGLGGLTAALCFTLFFWSRFLGGTAGMLEIILFVAGVVFLLTELFIIPGFGVAGISGILLVLASLILANQSFVVPRTPDDWSQTTTTMGVILASGLVFTVVAFQISHRFGSLPVLNRFVLAPPDPSADTATGSSPGAGDSPIAVGGRGIALSTLRPAGKAKFGPKYADVVTDGEFIPKGGAIVILEIRGNRIVVGPG